MKSPTHIPSSLHKKRKKSSQQWDLQKQVVDTYKQTETNNLFKM